ncbi:hypothetical protein L2E82_19840 [Cichorium intybus]|uniref:Uncharacterized protein n=1 Tax=Cichorium intybus TaxID=13427 RepID=A0ACB9DRW7_CICIN|nr:hypothetical protein L1887_21188 [Cichorium endivia]KAI3749233.1 hypothetical protein L2E82_19840 [Cichorium intybus]
MRPLTFDDADYAGIQPHVTLHHLDLPQILEDEYGGWISRKSVKDFVAYADVCFREFGDRVLHWTTFNEANVFALGGYDMGFSPPGRCSSPFGFINCSRGDSTYEPYLVAHHLLLAHASVVRLYREKYKASQHGVVGINVLAFWYEPYTNTMEDLRATKRANDFYIGCFHFGSFDFLGINHYTTIYVKDNPNSLKTDTRDTIADMAATFISVSGGELVPSQLPVIPWGLQKLLNYLKEEYGNPPIYIHENGQVEPRNGTLMDTPRVEYLQAYIGVVLDALRNGSNTRGYFVWSFFDLFEMLDGYKSGYGLYYVDLDDKELTRYPKLSADWYANFLKGKNVSGIIPNLKVKDYYSS